MKNSPKSAQILIGSTNTDQNSDHFFSYLDHSLHFYRLFGSEFITQ